MIMALEHALHSPKPLPQMLRKHRAALKPLGLILAFEMECEAIFRNRLPIGLGHSPVFGVHDPLWLLEGYVSDDVPAEILWLPEVRA